MTKGIERNTKEYTVLDSRTSGDDDLKGTKRKRPSTTFSVKNGCGRFTPHLRSKLLKF